MGLAVPAISWLQQSVIFFLLGAVLLIGLGITFWLSQDRRPRATAADSKSQMEAWIRRVGLDLGATSGGVLSWAVFARNSRIGPSTLRGSYVDASGNVALGPGLGVNVLVGGSRRTIVLQPLSVERAIGFNLAAGVTSLTPDSRGRG
jgi:hypothetical protein